ncbi:MAG TPA: bacteriohopanetetrol glucosamine biosynthesis glycosyltransferase HpnI [Candidatus Sulfotelmatobacter sp.]|nr:bacteriohopanetetrol glucosamine biosynthesis glycosyltransferase HpnI [Candidatus Sulfotelmatobacter sp.]
MLGQVLLVLIGLALAYGAAALVAMARLARHPGHRDVGYTPPITILKPIKGLDPDLLGNLRSFCRQDYPAYQILFGAADPQDPALGVVRQVLAEHPDADAHLVLCPEPLGPNGKVSSLHQMAARARHEILVISDSDTRVAPDYLHRVAAPFADPEVGLVTALYRGVAPAGLAAHLERLIIHTLFVPSVLVAYLLEGMTFALGATLAMRRKVLDELGGFAAFTHVLADDYQIGRRAVAAGYTVALADAMVDCVLGQIPFRDFFARQVRWARTMRSCRPAGYLASFIRHGVFLSLLFLLAEGPTPLGLGLLLATIALRHAVAVTVSAKVLRVADPVRGLWLLPLADALSVALWALAFAGNTITWRGLRYRMGRGGVLTPLHPPSVPERS